MRSGTQKTKSAAHLKTRRCVVRVKRMKPQPNKNSKRTVSARAEPTPPPLKKRIAAPAKSNTSLSTSFKAKDRTKTPTAVKNFKAVQQLKKIETPVVEVLPPTIAAGRSRRVHKPNPKYANEDLLTPKSLKPSASNSLSDFYKKASNDEDFDLPRYAKTQKVTKQQHADTDSDFVEEIEDSDVSIYEKKARNRPNKTTIEPTARRSTVASTSTSTLNKTVPTTKTVPTIKAAPTQLQQLRRTLNASNISPLTMGKKRKLEDNSPTTTPTVAAKRPNISTSMSMKSSAGNGIVKRRQSPNVVAASEIKAKLGQTAVTTTTRETQDKQEKKLPFSLARKSSPLNLKRSSSVASLKTIMSSKSQQNPLQRSLASSSSTPTRTSLGKASSASTPSLAKSSLGKTTTSSATSSTSAGVAANKTKSNLSKSSASNKQQSRASTPVVSKKAKTDYPSSDVEETPTITIDDFETMPTFTIVNINDIINKKGDVLISEAESNAKSQSTTTTKSEPQRNVQKQQTPAQSQQSKTSTKKQNTESVKTAQPFSTSTPLPKKPAEKMTNTTAQKKVINRNSSGASKASPPITKNQTSTAVAKKQLTRNNNASEKKPAPRILNSVVSPRTKPIKPVIANLDISDDDPSGSVSLYTDEDDFDINDDEDDDDNSRYKNDSKFTESDSTGNESELVESPKKRVPPKKSPVSVASAKRKVGTPPTAAKENSAAINNCLPSKQTAPTKPTLANRKLSPEKVVVQREGNKIIKKITCFETWYVINIPADAPEEYERNSLDMPLIKLANAAKTLKLPSETWTTKVTLYELRKSTSKSNLIVYNGDLTEQKIKESDRANYQPSCVMFRRTVSDRTKLQLPYDRAVIFKNKTFFTNIEGKNVKLVGAPTAIKDVNEVETLLNIVDSLTLQSPFVEPAATIL